jgi:hypothetical protein
MVRSVWCLAAHAVEEVRRKCDLIEQLLCVVAMETWKLPTRLAPRARYFFSSAGQLTISVRGESSVPA